ncbi:uncharacterized protein METZ01_LOCUS134203, partial [marine metagenome]
MPYLILVQAGDLLLVQAGDLLLVQALGFPNTPESATTTSVS